jgi:hypothetical protein
MTCGSIQIMLIHASEASETLFIAGEQHLIASLFAGQEVTLERYGGVEVKGKEIIALGIYDGLFVLTDPAAFGFLL